MSRWAKLEILPLLVVLSVLGYIVAGADLEAWKIVFAFVVFSIVPSVAAIFYGRSISAAPTCATPAHIQGYLNTIHQQQGVLRTCSQLFSETVLAIESASLDRQRGANERIKKMLRYLERNV